MNNIGFDYKAVNIRITTFGVNSSDIEGLSEFKEELSTIYNVESNDEESVACGGSSELGLIVDIGKLFVDSAVSGAVWDLSKGVLLRLYQSVKKLSSKNQNLDLYVTVLNDDFELRVSEAMSNSYGTIETLFITIYDKIQYLNAEGFQDISCISMPFIETGNKESRFEAKVPYTDFSDYWWEVQYNKGLHVLYFNPKTQEIFIQPSMENSSD